MAATYNQKRKPMSKGGVSRNATPKGEERPQGKKGGEEDKYTRDASREFRGIRVKKKKKT